MFRVLIALMLAVIGLQATPAQPLPNRPIHGSAFSASTADTALPVTREWAKELKVAAIAPPARPSAPTPALAAAAIPAQVWPDNRQTGPPLRERPPRGTRSPRAPPF
jgi:hypothetical protein